MSLGFRREIRVKDTHWGIFKTKMGFKAKKLEAIVSVENKRNARPERDGH